MADKKEGIYKSLLEAQKSIPDLPKDSRNTYSNYDYTSAETIIKASRDCLNKQGLVLFRENWNIVEDRLISCFVLVHCETGESLPFNINFPICLTKGKTQDKAVSSSLTSSLSYFLRDLLQIPRVDAQMDESVPETDRVPMKVSQGDIMNLAHLMQETGTNHTKFMEYFGIKDLSEMDYTQYKKALNMLQSKSSKSTE